MHNHADSHCWLTVLDGEMREVQYQPRDGPPDGTEQQEGAVYVEETHTTDMKVRRHSGQPPTRSPTVCRYKSTCVP